MKVRVHGTSGLCDASLIGSEHDGFRLRIRHPNGEDVWACPEAAYQSVIVAWATRDEWIDLLKFGFTK